MWLFHHRSAIDTARDWLTVRVGWPGFSDRTVDDPLKGADAAALPVLIALLGDSSPQVRYYAAQRIDDLGDAGLPALPALRRLADDQVDAFAGRHYFFDETVSAAVSRPLWRLSRLENRD